MKEFSVLELKQMMDAGEAIQLIDVRELWELEVCVINGSHHIPMGEILTRTGELNEAGKVVIQCRSGGRSSNVVNALEMHTNKQNLYNLKGGILAWAEEVDTSLEKY